MRITADTTLLVRSLTQDDPAQARAAEALLESAELVAVSLPALCELAWVLARGYRIAPARIAAVMRRLAEVEKIALNRPAVAAGIALLEAGGDFADGVIAHAGRELGGEVFVSFDRHAVELLSAAGVRAALAGSPAT